MVTIYLTNNKYYGIVILDYQEVCKASMRQKRYWIAIKWIACLILLIFLCYYGCPFYQLFNIRCPGCGLTRAWLRFLNGEWEAALAYHRLFWLAPGFLLLCVYHDGVSSEKQKKIRLVLYLFAAVFVVNHIYRII